jgi:hypothetical protein
VHLVAEHHILTGQLRTYTEDGVAALRSYALYYLHATPRSTNRTPPDAVPRTCPEHRSRAVTSGRSPRADERVTTGIQAFPKLRMRVRFPSSAPHIAPCQRPSVASGRANWPSSGPTWAPEPSRESFSAFRSRAVNWASSAAAMASSDARLLCW